MARLIEKWGSRHPGYDHSYWFISSFIDDHLRHHAEALGLA